MRCGALCLCLATGLAVAQPGWAGVGDERPVSGSERILTPAAALAHDAQGMIEVMYADIERLKRRHTVSTNKVLAVGVGAGLGYVAGAWAAGAILNPGMATVAASVGFPSAVAANLGSTVGTISMFSLTYAGGLAGDALVD